MANFNYGNSFNSYEGENVGVERISVWKSVREFFPGGAVLTPEDYKNATGTGDTFKVGEKIPAGTPIYVDKPGGKAKFTDLSTNKPIGLTYEDVILGNVGATFTIVTQGEVLISRVEVNSPRIPSPHSWEEHLFGRISFIKEV